MLDVVTFLLAQAPDLLADPAPIPPSQSLDLVGSMVKMIVMLLVTLGVIYLVLHKGVGKLVERNNIGKRVKIVERVSLEPRRSLYLVDIDGKQMLIAAGEGGVTHLKDVDAPPPTEEKKVSLAARFADVLEKKSPTVELPRSES
jgi:flagellar biogenesis protein FliO